MPLLALFLPLAIAPGEAAPRCTRPRHLTTDTRALTDLLAQARTLLDRRFSWLGPDPLGPAQVHLHLEGPDRRRPGEAATLSRGADEVRFIDISLLQPTCHPRSFRSSFGQTADEHYFLRTLVHELSGEYLHAATGPRHKATGWRFYAAPSWFVQGAEELVTMQVRGEVGAREAALLVAREREAGGGVLDLAADPYGAGALAVAWLVGEHGEDGLRGLLASEAGGFEEALVQVSAAGSGALARAAGERLARDGLTEHLERALGAGGAR